jgi:hypothetical protein
MSTSASDLIYKTNELECFHIDPAAPEATWKAVQNKCGFLTDWGVSQLRRGLDGFVQSVVLEPRYMCKDHRNLYSNFYSKKFLEISSNCRRLHFFSTPNLEAKQLLADPEAHQSAYLGFSVIRPVNIKCLGRTVIDPAKIGKGINDGYYLLRTKFRANINGADFWVEGYPFTSQDADATLCAHSALWGVCRYLSQKYPHYRELYPFDFVKLTESREGRSFPYRGMTYNDYCKILTDFGAFPVPQMIDSPESFQDLYSYVESGFPVLASIRLPQGGHVVGLTGHTLDYNAQITPTNGFVDSSQFLKQFIVVDDNFFPYQLLGYSGDPESYAEAYKKDPANDEVGIETIKVMTCPLPEKVFLPAKDARKKALKYCEIFASYIKNTGAEPFVTRMFVTSSSSFKKRKLLAAKINSDPASSLVANLHLPHFLWIMEISPVDIYKTGNCSAEIVLDATAGAAEDGVIYVRIGNQVHFAGKNTTVWNDIPGPTIFSQYTHNLGERVHTPAGT